MAQLITSFVLAAVVVFSTSLARADYAGADHKQLVTFVHHGIEKMETRVLFDRQQEISSPEIAPALPRLERIAKDQAGIWGDTILEGDYDADGATSLDRVEGIYADGQLVAYRISYSEQAWRTDYNGVRVKEGRIEEGTFVSPALTSWFRDQEAMAEFTASN